jgi:predicted nucleic acid-binding protein
LTDLLPRFYGTVLIPPAVFSELTAASTPDKVASWVSHPPEWLQVRSVPLDTIGEITEDLDDGEREAMALQRRLAPI